MKSFGSSTCPLMRSVAASLVLASASLATCAVPFARFAVASAAISPAFPTEAIRPPEPRCGPTSDGRVLPDRVLFLDSPPLP